MHSSAVALRRCCLCMQEVLLDDDMDLEKLKLLARCTGFCPLW